MVFGDVYVSSYHFHIFKQIQATLSVADRVCLRIFTDGLLHVQVIVGENLLESIYFELTVTICIRCSAI